MYQENMSKVILADNRAMETRVYASGSGGNPAYKRGCGLIRCRKQENKRFYSISDPAVLQVIDAINPDFVVKLSKVVIEEIL